MPDYYKQINGEGTFDYEDFYADVAARLPEGCTIAEVGVASGRSAIYLAEALTKLGKGFMLWMIDDLSYGGESQLNEIRSHIQHIWTQLSGGLQLQVGKSAETAGKFNDRSLDFVFIDAEHTYEAVAADIRAWLPKVKPGGFIAGHDYRIPGVAQAVQELLPGAVSRDTRDCWQIWSCDVR